VALMESFSGSGFIFAGIVVAVTAYVKPSLH
jgi:hypothetical protein